MIELTVMCIVSYAIGILCAMDLVWSEPVEPVWKKVKCDICGTDVPLNDQQKQKLAESFKDMPSNTTTFLFGPGHSVAEIGKHMKKRLFP